MTLQVQNISKTFHNTEVLHDISFAAEKGEFIPLLGPSGCGKSTLLRIIAGLETPRGGQISVGGEDITHPPYKSGVWAWFFSTPPCSPT